MTKEVMHQHQPTMSSVEAGQSPLHMIGHIQGNLGNVIYLSCPNMEIVAVDADIHSLPFLLSQPMDGETLEAKALAQTMIGKHIGLFLPAELCNLLSVSIDELKNAQAQRTYNFYKYQDFSYGLSITCSQVDYKEIGIEIEPVSEHDPGGKFTGTLLFLGHMMESYASDIVTKTACDTIFKQLDRYDRGMVYRFHGDLSGEVIHEIMADGVTSSFLGLRFPAMDIPLPARQLYMKTGLRFIQNVDAAGIPIVCNMDRPIDLTQCRMRAVHPCHLTYLRNMGVKASMSLPIVVDGVLWGLVTFHAHREPYAPSISMRLGCETIGKMASVRLEAILKKAQSARLIQLSECLLRWRHHQNLIHNLFDLGDDVLGMISADVVVAKFDPPVEDEESIVIGDGSLSPRQSFWGKFDSHPNRELLVVTNRQEIATLDLTHEDCPVAGFVYFRQGPVQVMLGRGSVAKDVAWAGNPDDINLSADGNLTPRASFNIFMEKAREESLSWTKNDLAAIKLFRDCICDHTRRWTRSMFELRIEGANAKYVNAIGSDRESYQFFAHLSHELRTPLHGVLGCLNVLRQAYSDNPKEDAPDLIETALSSGNHMMNILNDILVISKDKYGSNHVVKDRHIYQDVTRGAVDGFRSLALSKHVDFSCEITPDSEDPLFIEVDKTKLIQIVANLVSNAIKFAMGGSVRSRFDLIDTVDKAVDVWSEEAKSHAGLVFSIEENQMLTSISDVYERVANFDHNKSTMWMIGSVADSGCGMAPRELSMMFEPYTQASSASKVLIQGTGLGLYICVSLCWQLKGFIACASTPDEGTIFHFGIPVDIPVELRSILPSRQPTKTVVELTAERIQIRGPILVVDDNEVSVKVLHRALVTELKRATILGVDVIKGDGGAVAIELYRQKRPSLVIIDYHMPEIDGVMAVKTIRRYEDELQLPRAYIITCTADTTETSQRLILSSGSNETMSKPPPKGFIASLVSRFGIFESAV